MAMDKSRRQSPKGLIQVSRKKGATLSPLRNDLLQDMPRINQSWREIGFEIREVVSKEVGAREFHILGPGPKEIVEQMLSNMEAVADEAIQNTGADPADWRNIEQEAIEANAAYFAARVIGAISNLKTALTAAEVNAGNVYELVQKALSLGFEHHALEVVINETAIVTHGKAIAGGPLGGRPETIERDIEFAKEFQQRRQNSHMSDTALKQKIGAENNLRRSAAIAAIDRGLKKLSG